MKPKSRHSNKDLKQSKAVDLHLEAGTGKRRSRKALLKIEAFLNTQVWYNRHENRRIAIEEGECLIVDVEPEYPRPPGAKRTIQRDIWEQAKKAAHKAEKRYGIENMGPWSDYEWGMINGKLSAIRWALGEELAGWIPDNRADNRANFPTTLPASVTCTLKDMMNTTISTKKPSAKLVVAISSRALFDLDASHQVYEESGEEGYSRYQIEHEEIPLSPGVAFPLVKKLLALNTGASEPRVEVTLLSRNSADTGLRVFNSIHHHGLDITRAAFTRGKSPYRYIEAFGAHLFLSTSAEDVRSALSANIAAATILPSVAGTEIDGQLRIAFDGDAVLFSDESERIYAENGLEAFNRNEVDARETPLQGGPFKPFLASLHAIQSEFPVDSSPIRTALITARGAPAHERVIRTLRSWGIRIDEALFLGGMEKGAFLKSFGADIFFDDQMRHCDSAAGYVATGHVPFGVKNH